MKRRRWPWALLLLGVLLLAGLFWEQTAPSSEGPSDVPSAGPSASRGRAAQDPARPKKPRATPRPRRPTAPPSAQDSATLPDGAPEQEPLATVQITVRDMRGRTPEGRVFAYSRDCNVGGPVEDGSLTLHVSPGVCTFEAARQDGLLTAHSEPLALELQPDESRDIELLLPAERQGGLGVQITAHALGVQVQGVVPGSPAERFGLREGDIIVEVDGQPVADMELEDFVDTMTGPEGSKVEFRVTWEGDTGNVAEDLVLVRELLGRS